MPGPDDPHDRPKTPPEVPERTTPYGTPTPSAETAEIHLGEPSLVALRQRYDILEEVGHGGMGIVYRARDRETGDVVALKVLKPEIAGQPDLIERFKSELLLARKITHKNVCRTYELLRFGDTVAISMEYVEGESLRSLLQRVEGLSVRQGLKILRQILTGLAEAHAQGVVHRDLKPENVVIPRLRDGSVKVMDFGIARSIEAAATQTGGIIGTPAYMSPEQAQGKPVDARSDIYALGLIMYEMFVGKPAFHAETPAGLAYKHIHETPTPARAVDPYLPVFLERAIDKCLEKDPKKRFQSVAQVEAALEEQAAPELVEGEPVPAPHLSVWGKRDWILLALGVIGLIYFLEFRNTVFPAATKPLEVDAISAQRAAEDLARRLGRPFPEIARAQLEYRGQRYWNTLLSSGRSTNPTYLDPRKLHDAYTRAELPVYWKVTFRGPWESFREAPTRYALVDRKGRVEELSNPYPAGWTFPNYQVPPTEQRRAIARSAVELACGSLPPNLELIESSGGEQGASYTAVFRPSRPIGNPPVATVSLQGEKVVALDCSPQTEPAILGVTRGAATFLQFLFRLAILIPIGQMILGFGIGHRLPIVWKRAPLAVVLGLVGIWMLAPTFDSPPNTAVAGPPPSLLVLMGGGLAAAALILVGLVTTEYYFVRRTPAWIATYGMAWRGRFRERTVALAVFRGACVGLVLAGLETLVFYLSLRPMTRSGMFLGKTGVLLWGIADPTAVGQSITSISPVLFVVSAAIFNGVMLGLVFMGFYWPADAHKKFLEHRTHKGVQLLFILVLPAFAWLATFSFRLPLGQGLGFELAAFFAPMIVLAPAAWALVAYDALTAIVAVGTAVLWILNYPLLQILQNVGNGGQWAVFIGWGVLVAAAAAVAFRAQLVRAVQRAKAEMQ